jgi:predicted secreted protein
VSIAFAVAIYFVIWWTVLFVVLPFAGRSQHAAGVRVPGTPASAPEAPKLVRVMLITSLLAAVGFALVYLAIEFDLLTQLGMPLRPPAG